MVFLLQTSCAPTKEGAGRDEASSSPPPYPSAASLTASDAGPIRAIAVVAATSMVTLPTVRTRSGIISTAISRARSEEHTSELQSLMRISYAVFCLKQKQKKRHTKRKSSTNNQNDNTNT